MSPPCSGNATGSASTRVWFVRTAASTAPSGVGSVGLGRADIGAEAGAEAGAETGVEATLPLARALCTGLGSPVSPCSSVGIDAGCADVGRGGGDGGGGRGGRGGGRTSGGGISAGGSAGRWAQRVGAPGEAPRGPCCCGKDRFCAAEPVRGCCRGVGAGFLAASDCAGGGRVGAVRWAGCLLGNSWPNLVREPTSECAEVRLCSTPAVYAVACLASSQPAAIFDCTGSTIDLAMEAIDETTAAPVEPPRCGAWEAAMLWAAAIASIATIVVFGFACVVVAPSRLPGERASTGIKQRTWDVRE